MNHVTIIGNLGKEPELRYTPQGKPVLNFSIADTPRRKNDRGEWEDAGETLWLDCSLWGDKAEAAAATLAKGTRVMALGSLKARSYETRTGEKRTVIEATVTEVAPLPKREQGAGWNREQQNDPWAGGNDAAPF